MTVHAQFVLATMPTIDDIRAAARRIEGLARRTPLLESPALNKKFGARLLFKPEVLQRTGSFKFRGAYNKIASLTEEERACGDEVDAVEGSERAGMIIVECVSLGYMPVLERRIF